jgi:hypothetical protein
MIDDLMIHLANEPIDDQIIVYQIIDSGELKV